jgi:hypothetical protein
MRSARSVRRTRGRFCMGLAAFNGVQGEGGCRGVAVERNRTPSPRFRTAMCNARHASAADRGDDPHRHSGRPQGGPERRRSLRIALSIWVPGSAAPSRHDGGGERGLKPPPGPGRGRR